MRKRADWMKILKMLKKLKKCLINWCPSIDFPIDGGFPRTRQAYRGLINMFFNPDPARRLRLVPIEGMALNMFNSCCSTNMNRSRAHH